MIVILCDSCSVRSPFYAHDQAEVRRLARASRWVRRRGRDYCDLCAVRYPLRATMPPHPYRRQGAE